MSTAQLSDQQVLELGAKLRSARESQGKNLSEAAFRIALSPSQLRALESGDRRPFYSTHYFLQAVDRYANFLGVTLAELAAYRAAAPSTGVAQQQDAEPASYFSDDEPPVEAKVQALPRNINAPAAVASSASRSTASERKRPTIAVLAIGAAVVVLSAVITMKDGASPPAPVAAITEPPAAAATPAQAAEPATATATETAKPAIANAAPAAPPSSPAPQAAIAQAAPPPSAPPPSVAAPAGPASKRTAASGEKDARIESSTNAWVQIVSKSGEKSNLRIGAGESIEFASGETAAVVIGQPEKATLTVRGKAVDLRQYASSKDGSSRALVIIGDIRN